MKKKILFFSGSRAEYYIQSPILKNFYSSKKFKTYLMIGGSHTSKVFGKTVNLIKKDNLKIDYKIDLNITSNKKKGLANYILNFQNKITSVLLNLNPDYIFLTSDRFETLSVAIIAHILKVPIVHLEGGDVTEGGTLDDNSRHAITKLSSLHLVTNLDSEKRLIKLGEEKKRILNVGFPPLSSIKKNSLYNKEEIEKILKFNFNSELSILTYHPVPSENNLQNEIFSTIKNLSKKGHKFIITYPNFDPGYEKIIKQIGKLKNKKNIFVIKNLGQKLYFSILNFIGNNRGVCIGNSSSGIKETMFFNCKVINLGIRQRQRFKSTNVYSCKLEEKKIFSLFNKIISKKMNFSNQKNPYYSPNKIKKIDIKIHKKLATLHSQIKKITY